MVENLLVSSILVNVSLVILAALIAIRARRYKKSLSNERSDKSYLSMALHEVRNLANAISFQVESLGSYLKRYDNTTGKAPIDYADDGARVSLDDIYSSSRALHNFIYEFFESRKNSASRELVIKNTNVSNAVRDTFKIFKGAINEKKLRLYSRSLRTESGSDIMAYTDPVKIKQILLNLVGNSIKYTNAGEITVDLKTSDSHIALIVSDTGIGIPKKELKKISDMYFRASNSINNDGVGVGLHIVSTLVKVLEGSIDIESTEGRGTSVSVVIPRKNNATKVL